MLHLTLGYMCLYYFCFPQGKLLVVRFLGHMIALVLVFYGISIPSSIVALSMSIATKVQEGSLFSTPSPEFIVCRLFDDGHYDWYEVISHSFDLHFSNDERY